MTYENIVFAWNAQADEYNQYDTLSDRERIEFALSLSGKVEKQGPVAEIVSSTIFGLAVRKLNGAILAEGTKLYTAPQPCPECAEKQSAIDVWEGRYTDKADECEKLKAEVDEANDWAFRASESHVMTMQRAMNAEAERDELAAQVERMREALLKLATLGNGSQYGNSIGNCIAQEALALPDLSTGILNRVRVDVAKRCAKVCDVHATGWNESPGCNPMAGFIASSNCATDIRKLAADMEAT